MYCSAGKAEKETCRKMVPLCSSLTPCISQHIRSACTTMIQEVHRAFRDDRAAQNLNGHRYLEATRKRGRGIGHSDRNDNTVNAERCTAIWWQLAPLLDNGVIGKQGDHHYLGCGVGVLKRQIFSEDGIGGAFREGIDLVTGWPGFSNHLCST